MAPAKGSKKRKQGEGAANPAIRKPKRPMSAYNYFYKDEYARILAANAKKGVKANFEDVAKLIGSRWREIKAEALRSFERRSEEDAKRYRDEMNVYYDKQNEMRHAKYFKAEPEAAEESGPAPAVVERDSPSPLLSEESGSSNGNGKANYSSPQVQAASGLGLPKRDPQAPSSQLHQAAEGGGNLLSLQGVNASLSNQNLLLQSLLAVAQAQRQQTNWAASSGMANAVFPAPGMDSMIANLFHSCGGALALPQQQQQHQHQFQDPMALQKVLGLSNLLNSIQQQQLRQNSASQPSAAFPAPLPRSESAAAGIMQALSSGIAAAEHAAVAEQQVQRDAAQRASWQHYVAKFLEK
jgi:hypothetical protein